MPRHGLSASVTNQNNNIQKHLNSSSKPADINSVKNVVNSKNNLNPNYQSDINKSSKKDTLNRRTIVTRDSRRIKGGVFPDYITQPEVDNSMIPTEPSSDPQYDNVILDNTLKENKGRVVHFRKARTPLSEHPLNTTYNEDATETFSKGLMIGGTAIVAKGVHDALPGPYKPVFTGATLVGAGALIYKLTDQDIKKFYRNYVSRLEGNYENLISYNDYAQFVKKYHFKYEEDYYFLNDILAGKEDPIDMNKFMEMNRYNLRTRPDERD